MRVLAIDTSSNVATVAVMEDELLLGEYILNHKNSFAEDYDNDRTDFVGA